MCLTLLAVWPLALPGRAAAADARDLAAEAKDLAAVYRRRFGEGYTTHIDRRRRMVYVSALDGKTFRKVERMLGHYADAQQDLLFPQPLLWNVAVVLPTLRDYRKSVPPDDVSGYYQPATRTLTSISVSDVLIHEFTHALHHSDQVRRNQRHPVWITEGLATLFQGAWSESGRIAPRVDPTLAMLQGAAREKRLPSLADLCDMTPQAFRDIAEIAYPYVRYVMLYLYRQEKLEAFYEAYTSGYASDPTGRKALETVLGKPLEAVERAWRQWLLALDPPWTPAHPVVAHLGVRMRPAERGVMVDGYLPGSVAERAGVLRVQDVILSVAGRATPTPRDLGPAVRACEPGETVEIEILRGGERMVVTQVLGAVRRTGR
ncbi:MAG: PDZ domain-containing protein [Phycisphaerae bacterium]